MNTKIFTTLPQDAKDIRIEVFMNEQGFENEFDEIDTISHHIVAGSLTPLFTIDLKHSA